MTLAWRGLDAVVACAIIAYAISYAGVPVWACLILAAIVMAIFVTAWRVGCGE